MLCDLLAHQGWISFFSAHQVYYPLLVQEFYGNMIKVDEKLVTNVRGCQITIKPSMFARTLDILTSGATMDLQFLVDDALVVMTQDEDVHL